MTIKETILEEAQNIVHSSRMKDYGTPLDNHTLTAELFSAYLGVPITAEQVCYLNILQKISRSVHSFKRDNLVDIAGYTYNLQMIQDERELTFDLARRKDENDG